MATVDGTATNPNPEDSDGFDNRPPLNAGVGYGERTSSEVSVGSGDSVAFQDDGADDNVFGLLGREMSLAQDFL